MDSGHLAFFDFGMVGRITPRLQSQMIDAFFHVVSRDVQGLGQDILNLNFLKPGSMRRQSGRWSKVFSHII